MNLLLIIAVLGSLGLICWAYEKGKRTIAWLLAVPAFFLAAVVTPWRDALATLTSTKMGLLVLVVIFIASGAAFWFEGVVGHKHHHITSAVAGIVCGTSAVMVIGHGPKLLHILSKSPASAGKALAVTQHQISTGHAARHMSQHSALMLLLFVIGGILLAAYLARRVRGPQRSVTLARPTVPRRRGRAIAPAGGGGGSSRAAIDSSGSQRPVVPFGGGKAKR